MFPIVVLELSAIVSSKLMKVSGANGEGSVFQCRDCDYQSNNLTTAKRHIESKHIATTYYCNHCNHTAPTQHALRMHLSRKHPSY